MSLKLQGPGESYVEVIADSVSKDTGDRVTSFEVNAWRFTLAEWNTHSLFNRNSASSRAIPVEKQLARYTSTPAMPLVWPAEKPGMQGGNELEGKDLRDAIQFFEKIHELTSTELYYYLEDHPEKPSRLHKSLLNRLLEPLQWHCMLITASSYENFFDQRVSPGAQPELRVCAELMKQLYEKSDPVEMVRGMWHTPYVREDEGEGIKAAGFDIREISVARCARTSYMSQQGEREFAGDVNLCVNKLLPSGHMSPFAHVCTPDSINVQTVGIFDPDNNQLIGSRRLPRMGHYTGWQEYRHVVEGRMGHVSVR